MLLRYAMLGWTIGLVGCSSAPWTRMEKALLGVNIACHAVDYAQTEWAMDHGYSEVSPLMGESPSDERILTTKLAMQGAIYAAAADADDKALAFGLALVPCVAAVAHNYSIGARP